MRKMIIIVSLTLLVLSGCSSEPPIYQISDSAKQVIHYTSEMKYSEGEVKTVFLEKIRTHNDFDRVKNYSIPIAEWISKNRNKEILNISNYPAQGGASGIFITFVMQDDFENDYKVLAIDPDTSEFGEFGEEKYYGQNNIKAGNKYLSTDGIVTATTINGWRGGVNFIIVIYE